MMSKNVMVVYGGVSPEHDVSIVSALQVMNALKTSNIIVMPVYIAKDGLWYLGDDSFLKPESYISKVTLLKKAKRVILSPDGIGLLVEGWFGWRKCADQPDVVFPVIHGRGGEDGTLQGLFEMSGVPYVGCEVTASAVKIDKYLAKKIASTIGIPVLWDKLLTSTRDLNKSDKNAIKFPVMVKPVGLGSSIGLSRAENAKELDEALGVAFCYDRRVMIEKALSDFYEVNISIIGNDSYTLSMTEEPISTEQILSFADKYEGGNVKGMAGAQREIPARVDKKVIKQIEEYASSFFREIGGKGIARVDFLVTKTGEIYFNEINTMPGSLAFYLWKASGMGFSELVTRLVDLAIEEHGKKTNLVKVFSSNILSNFASQGTKGSKS
jgi:D-alanine-D-alanine ligase